MTTPSSGRPWLSGFILAAICLDSSAVHAQATLQQEAPTVPIYARCLDRVREAYRDTNPEACRPWPIGLFDSGTGGLTVLEQILRLDAFDNETHAPRDGGDGRPDFQCERFVFLADQANMPYGQYASAGRADFLRELALKDAEFLMQARQPAAKASNTNRPAKAVVIACNTATAYGESLIRNLIRDAQAPVFLLGVIQAGSEGALESLAEGQGGTIGVLATCGTVESNAYPTTLARLVQERDLPGPIHVVQQGSVGLAGAIDGVPDFIVPGAKGPRREYRGPVVAPVARTKPGAAAKGDQTDPRSTVTASATIPRECLARMAFDFSDGAMLCEGDPGNPTVLQINSVPNYVAYDVTMLLESVRRARPARPLRAVILGCTHFPYFADAFRRQLRRLYDYQEQGQYVYRPWMAERIAVIDPAQFAAKQLYRALARDHRLSTEALPDRSRAEFFITVPNPAYPGVALTESGWFTYDYKYGRRPGLDGADVLRVPLTEHRVGSAAWDRLRRDVPSTFELVRNAER